MGDPWVMMACQPLKKHGVYYTTPYVPHYFERLRRLRRNGRWELPSWGQSVQPVGPPQAEDGTTSTRYVHMYVYVLCITMLLGIIYVCTNAWMDEYEYEYEYICVDIYIIYILYEYSIIEGIRP